MVSAVKFAIPCTFCLGNAALVGSNWVFKSEKLVAVTKDEDWTKQLDKLAKKLGPDGEKEKITNILAGSEDKSKLELNDGTNFTKKDDAKNLLKKWCSNPTKGQEYVDELCKKYEQRNWLFG